MYVAAQPRPWMAIEMTVSTALFQIFYWFALIFIEITWGGKRDCLRIYPLFLRLPDLILEIDHKFFSAFSVDICSIFCPLQEIPLMRESLFGFRAHLHFGAIVTEEREMLEPAAKERLKKGGGAEEEEAEGNDSVAKSKQPEARHPPVRDPPEEGGGDRVGQPKRHEDESRGGGGEAVGVCQERL